jgi:hypothetical protein
MRANELGLVLLSIAGNETEALGRIVRHSQLDLFFRDAVVDRLEIDYAKAPAAKQDAN